MVSPRCRAVLSAGAASLLALTLLPGTAYADPEEPEYGFQGEQRTAQQLESDTRTAVAPIAGAAEQAAALGAGVVWNDHGTPASLRRADGGNLSGPRAGTAVEVARGWLADNAALFGLDAAELTALEVLADTPLLDAPDLGRLRAGEAPLNTAVSHVVQLRQTYGGVAAIGGGVVDVGVLPDGSVHYVSSSITPDTAITNSRTLSAQQAYVRAAADVGRTVALGDVVANADAPAGFSSWTVPGSDDLQRTRPRALAVPGQGVKLVWETVVLDDDPDDGQPVAFVHSVDAQTGAVLVRENRVSHLADEQVAAAEPASGPFSGTTGAGTAPGPDHPFDIPAGQGSVVVGVTAGAPTADLVVELFLVTALGRTSVGSADTAGNPEALTYAPAGGVPPGRYVVSVRPFDASGSSTRYDGVLQTSAGAVPQPGARPRWKTFPSHPDLRVGDDGLIKEFGPVDNRQTWCWEGTRGQDGCDRIVGFGSGPGTNGLQLGPDDEGGNTAARLPWDVNPRTGMSTRTTEGNQADTAPSFGSFLTPDIGAGTSPVAVDRNYAFPFTDQWFTSKCNETSFTSPARNDIDASTTNLFVGHNRMHDWSYYLGFTERNYNFQTSNFDNPATGGVVNGVTGGENDPEVGQSQAGAIGGGPTFQGRDNANQIALQDGIPGITNQYLWQPLQAGFYAPCVDGDYDFSVLGHEYGHGIQGRMVGGPDGGLTGAQAGSMNESWADLNAMEYANEFGFAGDKGENPFAVGAYVTGANGKGIRNYGMDVSPLNFSDIEYDGNGTTSPHADGEIWSATNFQIRQRLVAKYDGRFPSGDQALQTRCATGVLPADQCPGNRWWKQMVYDSYLLQQSGTSMVTAKDALLAADVLRFGGANQSELLEEFAERGFGAGVFTAGTADRDPVPSFATGTGDVAVTFAASRFGGGDAPAGMEVFVGTYEARATPVADTDPATPVDAVEAFTPGTYQFIARAPGFGAVRFAQTFVAGQNALVDVPMRVNLASRSSGAAATALSDGDNAGFLIDDTEESNAAVIQEGNVRGKQFTVDLAGAEPVSVKEIQVSAALRPALVNEDPAEGDDPNYDTGGQNRFSALRSFEVLSCTAAAGVACDSSAQFTSRFVSAPDAFPAARPRPTAPDLTLRPFDVPDFTATHVQLKVLENQCTGGPLFQRETNPDNSNNPGQDPDCDEGASIIPAASGGTGATSLTQNQRVRVAELQVFADPAPAGFDLGPDPVVPEAPATVLLLLTAVAVGGGVLVLRRRRA